MNRRRSCNWNQNGRKGKRSVRNTQDVLNTGRQRKTLGTATNSPPAQNEGVSDGQPVVLSRTVGMVYSGPLPPASEMAAYREISPDYPDRILKMAEREQKHRHQNEDRALDFTDRGQRIAAWLLVPLIAVLTGVLAYFGLEKAIRDI